MIRSVIAAFCVLSSAAFSQKRVDAVNHVDPGMAYYHIYAIVPMVGSGTLKDPKRPMFAPVPSQASATAVHTGVIGQQMVASDDGTMAFVEFVGATRNDLLNIINSKVPGVQVFERTSAPATANPTTPGATGSTAPAASVSANQSAIEAAFQKYKNGFSLANWHPLRVQ